MSSEPKQPPEYQTTEVRKGRRRLGEWLPRSEEHLSRFRQEVAARARERAATSVRNTAVDELAALVNGDPVLRMDMTRAIAQRNGRVTFSAIRRSTN